MKTYQKDLGTQLSYLAYIGVDKKIVKQSEVVINGTELLYFISIVITRVIDSNILKF